MKSFPTQSLHVAVVAEPSPLPALACKTGVNEYRNLRAALPAGRLGAPARSAICREALKKGTQAALVVALSLGLTLLAACGDDEDDPRGGLSDAWAVDSGSSGGAVFDGGGGGATDVAGADVQAVPWGGWEPVSYAGSPVGESRQGRVLAGERFGDSGPYVLLFFTIHGNEVTAEQLGERVRTWLLLHPEAYEGVQIAYVTLVNPDGYVAGTRCNDEGIDLNRNFPASNFDPTEHNQCSFGPFGGSEPETQAVVALVEDGSPTAIVTTHSPLEVVNYDGPAEAYAEAASEASGYPVKVDLGPYPGSFGSFAGVDLQIPTITLELERELRSLSGHDAGRRAISAVMAMAEDEGSVTGAVADLVPAGVDEDLYAAWKLTDSPGHRPVVVERFGKEGRPIIVVAGLDGPAISVFAAERLRALLLARLRSDLPPRQVLLVTVANPDGVLAGRRLNNDGLDPDEGFPETNFVAGATAGSAPLIAPETAALAGLVDDTSPAAVLVFRGGVAGVGVDGPADAYVAALRSGYEVQKDTSLSGRPGALATWAGSAAIPSLTVSILETPDRNALIRARDAALGALAVIDAVPDE